MLEFGSPDTEVREMNHDDIFSTRLTLLIIMCKAYLKGYPIGQHRKEAILENAQSLFYITLNMASETASSKTGDLTENGMTLEHVFRQRVQLLAIMGKALAEGRLVGHFKKKAFQDNLDYLCDAVTFTSKVSDMEFLKVA